jgi:hypothetical protein
MLMLNLWCHGEEIFCMREFCILSSHQEWIEWSPPPTHTHTQTRTILKSIVFP